MPYSRDQVVAELQSFYELLIRTHIPAAILKIPPPEGWPEITAERLGFLGKNDTVVDLLKHIPYIDDAASGPEYQIYEMTRCNDFVGSHFKKTAVDFQDRDFTEPMAGINLEDVEHWYAPYMVTLGRPAVADNGWFMFLDTSDGSIELADWIVGKSRYFNDAEHCFATLRKEYCDFEVVAVDPTRVMFLSDDSDNHKYVEIYKKHGWLSADYNQEACIAEVRELYWS